MIYFTGCAANTLKTPTRYSELSMGIKAYINRKRTYEIRRVIIILRRFSETTRKITNRFLTRCTCSVVSRICSAADGRNETLNLTDGKNSHWNKIVLRVRCDREVEQDGVSRGKWKEGHSALRVKCCSGVACSGRKDRVGDTSTPGFVFFLLLRSIVVRTKIYKNRLKYLRN